MVHHLRRRHLNSIVDADTAARGRLPADFAARGRLPADIATRWR